MKKSSRKSIDAQHVREGQTAYTRTARADGRSTGSVIRILGVELSMDVIAFCEREGILDELMVAGELISQTFPDIRSVGFRVAIDPETGDESVVIDLCIAGEIEDLVTRSQQYSASFVAKAPWPERSRIHVCYSVVE